MDKETLRRKLKHKTKCDIQYKGWPCGTCFYATLPRSMPAKEKQKYWRALLAYRGDYPKEPKDPGRIEKLKKMV